MEELTKLKNKIFILEMEKDKMNYTSMDKKLYDKIERLTATSFSEMAIDFNVLTYNVLPTAKGKKIIENIYKLIDKKLDLKGLSLYK